ncbi:MAG: HAD family hydrolase [Deltaproteobacteria bacterium]|nr:HAD family hydrolase [Deltaproteobacteria bacterium]
MNKAKYINLIKELTHPLVPLPTRLQPHLKPVMVKAVIFDIYGTLLISEAGDVGSDSSADDGQIFIQALTDGGWDPADITRQSADMIHLFRLEIKKAQQKSREKGVPYPEVDIRNIWMKTLVALQLPPGNGKNINRAAVSYECRNNPTWPMPGMEEVISSLKEKHVKLGVISNAQFYTPLIIEALTGHPPEALGFDPLLTVWSYQRLEGKPSLSLFKHPEISLFQQNISPDEIIYVGNDMLKDIWPATQLGWKTALFAGDNRSLRLREDDKRLSGVEPDLIITDLHQLADAVRLY